MAVGLQPLSLKETSYSGDNSYGPIVVYLLLLSGHTQDCSTQADDINEAKPVRVNRRKDLWLKGTFSSQGIQFPMFQIPV